MKIHTKVVIDMKSGAVERDEWHDYDGPVAWCGFISAAVGSVVGGLVGGGDQTTVVTSTPTAEELELQRQAIRLAEQQIQIIEDQVASNQEQFAQFQPLLEAQLGAFSSQQELQLSEIERARELQPITDELLQLELENIRRGGAASPEQIRLIEGASAEALASGESDIAKFQTDALGRLREELAGSIGLRPTDTPVLDRGARITEESVRQQGQLARNLAESRFTSRLNFPLGASQLQSSQTQFQQGLAQQVQQFQAQLSEAAFSNRLRLASTQGGLGVALASASSPFQTGSSNFTQTTSGGGNALGGIGGLLTGLGSIGFNPF